MEVLAALLFTWFLFGIIAGVIGVAKGRGCLSFFLGVLLGPLGIIIALFLKPSEEAANRDKKKCPFCAEFIKKEAKVCRFCGKDFPENNIKLMDKIQERIISADCYVSEGPNEALRSIQKIQNNTIVYVHKKKEDWCHVALSSDPKKPIGWIKEEDLKPKTTDS